MTPQETSEAFMTEFQDLLCRYNATFEIVDIGVEYHSHNVAEIYFNGIYDEDGNTIRKASEFQMPDYIS
jgi:hypothetical protein